MVNDIVQDAGQPFCGLGCYQSAIDKLGQYFSSPPSYEIVPGLSGVGAFELIDPGLVKGPRYSAYLRGDGHDLFSTDLRPERFEC